MSAEDASPELVGYADPFCVAPGEEVAVAVSSLSERYDARLVRFGGDAEARVVAAEVPWEDAGERPGCVQFLRRGSYLRVADARALAELEQLSLLVWAFPTGGERDAPAIASLSAEGAGAWRIGLDVRRRLTFWQDGRALVSTPTPLQDRAWHVVELTLDRAQAHATIAWRREDDDGEHASATLASAAARPPGDASIAGANGARAAAAAGTGPVELLFAAARLPDGRIAHRFNGKLEQPRAYRGPLDAPNAEPFAAWDLGPRPGVEIPDTGAADLHGALVNGPTRCVTGRGWDGCEVDWRNVPEQYAAIHFHDDDLDDAGWQPDVRWRVPDDLQSGVYALHVSTPGGEDHVPFVVSPPSGAGAGAHEIAVLIPTFSYLVYANEHNAWHAPTFAIDGLDRATLLERVTTKERFIAEQRLLSCYELHSDGSGVCMSSSRRPLLNMRPWYVSPVIDGPHQLAQDLELLAWLDAEGLEHDVVSDHRLHDRGVEALRAHRVVVLGSHPEYWSAAMLDALQQYQREGGRVVYLGGNGLYWVTGRDTERPWVVEVRRGFNGTRCWTSEPGEVHLQCSGETGGLWRYRGRAPQRLVGVGFTGQGFDTALPYYATAAARNPRAAFLFEGIDLDAPIGDAGSVLNGAAGFELDCADPLLGTLPHALVVARADGFSQSYQAAVEEIEVSDSLQGAPVNDRVRAEIVFYETPAGGAVLGVGSIAFCGALGVDGGRNPVARLIANALRGFASRDFAPPAKATAATALHGRMA